MNTYDGNRLLAEYKIADPNASPAEILLRATEQITSGVDLPRQLSLLSGSKLVNIVPERQGVSGYSPFFTSLSELERVSASSTSLSDAFGLPNVSSVQSFSVFEIEASSSANVFISDVAPTIDAFNGRPGGAQQFIVPNRGLFTDPRLLGTISN